MKLTFKKLIIAAFVFCTFVGVLPMITAEDSTAQAAASTIYYDFRKGNNGYPNAAADKRTAFAALTYDEVAARNTAITSGPWAYHSYSATPDSSAGSSDQSAFTSASFFYYNYDKTKGFSMITGARHGVLKAGIKFKGMNAGKYVPYLNLNGAYLRSYSGILTAKIYKVGSSTALVSKEICLSDYPEDDTYVQLSNAASFEAAEYYLELTINNERTMTIVNGLQLVAADSAIVTGLYPTNDLGVYEVKVGETKTISFTQVLSDGTTTTNKLSGWGYTSDNAYVTAGVNSSSRYFTIKGVAETSTPQTIYFSIGNAKSKINVIVRSASYTATQSDVLYNFLKPRPVNWTSNHVHTFGTHIKYNHTAVGGYGEINTAISSAPWKVVSVASTSGFSPLYSNYGIEHQGTGVTDLKIQVPVGGTYMPQLQIFTTEGVKNDVTVSILNAAGTSTICSTTIPAGTTTEYVNLSTKGVSLSAQEYIVRFNKTGSNKNYYNGIKLVKTSTTTVTLDPNGGTAGSKTSVTATYGFPMTSVASGLPTRTGYRFGGYFASKNGVLGSGTQYYTMSGTSNASWDKTASTATLYASWNVNTFYVKFNANGGSGTMSNQTFTYDTAQNLTANTFTRTGYTFQGWATSASGSVVYTDKKSVSNLSTTNQATVNLYAVWKANTYTVTLNGQSATSAGTTSVTATYGSAMPSITVPTKTGYTFGGYYTATNGGGTQYYTAAGASAKNWDKTAATTLYAKWTANTYTVTLDNQSATSAGTTSATATYGSAMPSITVPTKTGYVFGGYYDGTNGSGTQYYTAAGASARTWNKTAATTLYAKWTANTFYVKFNANGGSGTMSNQTFTYNTAQNLTANTFTRTGYTFQGWATSASGSVAYTDSKSVSNLSATNGATVNLYAVWKANTYTVTLNGQSATSAGTTSVTATYGSAMPSITVPTKTGYTFGGYYTATNGGGTQYYTAAGASAKNWDKTAATTLYAKWTANTYTVTLDNQSATSAGTTSTTATYGSAMPSITVPTKTGYVFGGYYTAANGSGTQYYTATGASARTWDKTAATTLYAKWTNGVVTLSSIGNKSVTAGSSLTFTASATSTAPGTITYSGTSLPSGASINASTGAFSWTPTVSQIGSHTFTIKATDSVNSASQSVTVTVNAPTSTVTLDAGGSVTVTYGSAMPAITAPKTAGKVFGGYYDGTNGTGTQYYTAAGASAKNWDKTGNVTLYAKWTTATVTVNAISDKSVTALSKLTFTASGSTNSGMGVTYSSANLPDGATLSTAGAFSWTPTLAQIGSYNIIITATDGSVTASTTVKVTVGAPSSTITFTAVSAKTVTAGGNVAFNLSATSSLDQPITYSSSNLPDGATLSTAGAFSWTPTLAQIGEHTVNFKAADAYGSAETSVKITVKAPTSTVTLNDGTTTQNVTATYGSAMPSITAPEKTGYIFGGYFDGENGDGNQYYKADGTSAKNWDKTGAHTLYAKWIQGEVTITQIGDKTVAVEEKLTFNVEASSTAGDITYTAENLPEGATFNTSTGEFSWTPTKDQAGEYTITFKGSDGLNYAEVTVNVVVEEIISTVNFDEGTDSITATYGEALPTITAPEKTGYIFDGYFDDEDGTGTKYYNADGTPTKNWDKKDQSVTLYAKWIEGDTRLGTRLAIIRDIKGTRENPDADGYSLYLLAGLDDRQLYDEVGFEVTINGQTISAGTNVVFRKMKDDKQTYEASAFGEKCNYGFVINFFFGKEYRNATVTFRPYAIDEDGNKIYGREATFEGIYTNLEYDEETGGDLVIDGEVEYA